MNIQQAKDLVIDWDMAPTDAVTLYLEWGNNSWHAQHQPVRSKSDFTNYFVVDTWGDEPVVRLVRRNSENAEDLLTLELPRALLASFKEEYGNLRGVFEPTPEIKEWLKAQVEN